MEEKWLIYEMVDLWYALYMNFNDDNINHCTSAFDSKRFKTYDDVRSGVISFLKEIMRHGHSREEILEDVPAAAELLKTI